MTADHDLGDRAQFLSPGTARRSDLNAEVVHTGKLATIDAHKMRVSKLGRLGRVSKLKSPSLISEIKSRHHSCVRQLVQTPEERRLIKSKIRKRLDDFSMAEGSRLGRQ